MHLTDYSWGPSVQTESQKFWFYALVVSILLNMYDLCTPSTTSNRPKVQETTIASEQVTRKDKPQLPGPARNLPSYTALIVDMFDLVIPGAFIGWTPLDPLLVGISMSISSIISIQILWDRVQQRADLRPSQIPSQN